MLKWERRKHHKRFEKGWSGELRPISLNTNDGNLYIAVNSTDAAAGLLPVVWDIASITEQNWVANETFFNGTSPGSLYIIPDDYHAVGVSSFATIAEVNGTVSGFALMASQLVYNDKTGLESNFWAQATALMWDTPGDLQDDSFPVKVKASEKH